MKKILILLLFAGNCLAQHGVDFFPLNNHVQLHNGNIYYVAVDGNDSNDGKSPSSQLLTIGAAIAKLDTGDIVIIKSGIYTETGLDLNVPSCILLFERGSIIDPANGTALTISAKSCQVTGIYKITPAAGQIGMLVSGDECRIENAFIVEGGTGISITGIGAVLNECAIGLQTSVSYDITASRVRLTDCSTVGSGATYGYKINGGSDTGVLRECTSTSHTTSGFYIDTGSQDWTMLNCSSGAGDGARIDIDNANVWSNYSYADEVFKEIDMTDATQAFGLFEITGTIEIEFLFGHVEEATNPELGNCLFRVYGSDGATTTNLTTATDCENLPIGSFIGKIEKTSSALNVSSSASPFVIEATNYKSPRINTIIGSDNTGTTSIQFYSDDAAGNKDGIIHFHCKWKPVSDDGYLKAL